MKVVVRPEHGWGRVTFEVDDEKWVKLKGIAEKYKFRLDEVLRIILKGEIKKQNRTTPQSQTRGNVEDMEELEKEIEDMEKRLYELEGKWSPLKFKAYYIALDNQNLAIQLSGMIAENKRLRKQLGLEEKDFSKLEGLMHYYMGFESLEHPGE